MGPVSIALDVRLISYLDGGGGSITTSDLLRRVVEWEST